MLFTDDGFVYIRNLYAIHWIGLKLQIHTNNIQKYLKKCLFIPFGKYIKSMKIQFFSTVMLFNAGVSHQWTGQQPAVPASSATSLSLCVLLLGPSGLRDSTGLTVSHRSPN